MKDVQMIGNVNYERIGDEGLLITYGKEHENPTWLDVDNIVLCAGQVPLRELEEPLEAAGIPVMSSAAPTSPPNSMPNAPSTRAAGWRPDFDELVLTKSYSWLENTRENGSSFDYVGWIGYSGGRGPAFRVRTI